MEKYDFAGWATRNDLKCSDGRIIRKDAFKHNDGQTVPLVWNHDHTDPYRIVGHALLENREEGVYAYGKFNDTELGKTAKLYVEHGDITQLSIYANQLTQQGPNVMHGSIREVSLVMAGANPGAYIETVLSHDDESSEEAIIYTGEDIVLEHGGCKSSSDDEKKKLEHSKEEPESKKEEKEDMAENGEKTLGDVINTLSEEQKTAVYALIGMALEDKEDNEDNEGGNDMKHNVFDQEEIQQDNVLSHSDMQEIISDAKRYGSMKESFLAHTTESSKELSGDYGIKGVDWLFPEAKTLNTPPERDGLGQEGYGRRPPHSVLSH